MGAFSHIPNIQNIKCDRRLCFFLPKKSSPIGGNRIPDASGAPAASDAAVIFKYFNQNIQLLLYFITQTSAY